MASAREVGAEEDGAIGASEDREEMTREGSGLGLAITHWAVETHGGEARVRSEVGRGSTFELWLPARDG